MKNIEYSADFCVVGGGLAGLCAAVSAARHGVKTVLMHDRSVLGGNSSSEIRMWVCGAHGKDNRETGIIEEIQLENFYRNPSHKFSIWDSVLYEKAILEPNLKLILDCSCLDADMAGGRIKSVTGWQSVSQTYYKITADYFADCSGDSILAPLSGAEYMYGREAKSEYGETIPPDKADKKTMGMSLLFQIRETDRKTYFTPPSWAYTYETDDDLPQTNHTPDDNFWWIELGGTKNCIYDTDECRNELLKIVYGVWDHMKNKGEHGVDNYELEWIGFLPGKRESRRYKGAYVINQNDVEAGGKFDDIIGYAGWSMDDHFPEGFYYRKGHPTIYHPAPSPWGITFRSLYSCGIKNLMFAGRNISVTHAALSSCRVMATCAVLGQAVGTAAAVMKEDSSTPDTINISKLQAYLMEDDCFLPGKNRKVSALSAKSECNSDIIRNGKDRGEENLWVGENGDFLEYKFDVPEYVNEVRIVFDSNLNRTYQNMPCRYRLNENLYKMPDTLIKEYKIIVTDENGAKETISVTENRKRFVVQKIGKTAVSIKLIPITTYGCKTFNIFSFEVR